MSRLIPERCLDSSHQRRMGDSNPRGLSPNTLSKCLNGGVKCSPVCVCACQRVVGTHHAASGSGRMERNCYQNCYQGRSSRDLGGAAVAEDVDADDVDLTSRITEERAEADEDPGVGVFASGAGLVPVGVGDDEEEVLGVGGDVGLPEVLEVVVVGRGPAALDLGDDPAAGAQAVDEVGARMGDESVAGCQDDFLAEPEVFPQQGGDDRLDGAALRAVDVDEVDLGGAAVEMRLELQCEGVDALELGGLGGSQRVAREALMPDLHARSFTAASATS